MKESFVSPPTRNFHRQNTKMKTHLISLRKAHPVYTYVPTTLLVFASVSSPPKILAMRKSEIFGFKSLSNKMLLTLRSNS